MEDVLYGHCWCGCGGKPNLATKTDHKKGLVKGEPRPYLFNHHLRGNSYTKGRKRPDLAERNRTTPHPFLGKKRPEHAALMREQRRGEKHHMYGRRGEKAPAWKGGVTPEHALIRGSLEYSEWRQAVFERDGYKCTKCKARSTFKNPIHAHHLKGFTEFPELRFIVDNGITLCKACHIEVHEGRFG